MVLEEAWVGCVDARGNRTSGRADYLLQAEIDRSLRAIAVLETKAWHYEPEVGAVQAREYARSANVPFAFATNGKTFVEVDVDTGRMGRHQPLSKFPTPENLLARHPEVIRKRMAAMRAAGEIPPLGRAANSRACPVCGAVPDAQALFCAVCGGLLADPLGQWVAASRFRRAASYCVEYLIFALMLGVGWFMWNGRTSKNGQTPAKRLFGLYVQRYAGDSETDLEAEVLSREAFWRLLVLGAAVPLAVFVHPGLFMAPFFIDGVWMLGASRRTLHDYFATTVVVSRRRSR